MKSGNLPVVLVTPPREGVSKELKLTTKDTKDFTKDTKAC